VLFIGYSPSMGVLTAIWMGNDDNTPAEAASGGLVAELWGRYMAAASRALGSG
jgi:peptidoglycan glycosyltransferase